MLYDVAVAGGGPVGSRVAYRLAGMGHKVVVVEKNADLREPVCCTGVIGKQCVDRFDINEDVIFRWANSASVFSPSGKLIHLWRQESQACILDRPAFNVSLAHRAQDRGVEYLLGSPVNGIEVRDDRVIIEAQSYGREAEFIEARVAVIANGFGSKLVGELGLGRVGDSAIGAQAEVETDGVDEVEVYLGQKVAPAFFAWLVPTSTKRALVGLISRRRPGFYLRRLMSSLADQGKINSAGSELSYGGIALKPLTKTYSDRVVVVGSAAGQAKPTNGGGIYYGLLCADIAADNLHRALESDNLSAKSLANYQKEWKKELGREMKLGYWGRRFYELLSDRKIDQIFDIIKNNGIDESLLKADDLNFDWHSRMILRLIGYGALSSIVRSVKLPFPQGRTNRR
jgi:digeranylgeranylglycerophospholipid reductase